MPTTLFVDLGEPENEHCEDSETTVSIGISMLSRDEHSIKMLASIDGEDKDCVFLKNDDNLRLQSVLAFLEKHLSSRADRDPLEKIATRLLALVPEEIRVHSMRKARREAAALREADEEPKFDLDLSSLLGFEGPREYLIEHILMANEQCVIGAPYKTLKTSIAIDLLISLETGIDFLGKFRVPEPTKVLMVSSETSGPSINRIFRRVAKSKGLDQSTVDDLVRSTCISFQRPQLDNPSHLRGISDELQQNDYGVLILDAAYQMMPSGSAGNLMAQNSVLGGINDICKANRTTLVIVHHAKTPQRPRPVTLDDLLWAGWKEWVRQWILLSRRERFREGSGSHKLFLGASSSLGHQGLYDVDIEEGVDIDGWNVAVVPSVQGRKGTPASKITAHEEQVIAALKKFPDGESKRTIRDIAGVSTAKFRSLLDSLLASGKVSACQVLKNNRLENGIKLSL